MNSVKSRRALGRGLSSLIPVDKEGLSEGEPVAMLRREAIRPNPNQPRKDFDEEEIRGLAESIRSLGLIEPIIVRKKHDGFEVVSGERRLRALAVLGEKEAPCIVREKVSDREMLEIALVENIQRKDLNEIEKAQGFNRLLVECGLSHEELSGRVGMSRSAVTNFLRLLKLPQEVQEMIRRGDISMGHARALLSVGDQNRQIALAQRIASEGLSVREVERTVQSIGHRRPRKQALHRRKAGGSLGADGQQIVERLRYRLGTAVMIVAAAEGKGTIQISYYDADDLNRIIDILLK